MNGVQKLLYLYQYIRSLNEKKYFKILSEFESFGVRVFFLNYQRNKGFDLSDLLQKLNELSIRSLLLEGGSFVWQSFLKDKKLDYLHQFISPKIIDFKDNLNFFSQDQANISLHLLYRLFLWQWI